MNLGILDSKILPQTQIGGALGFFDEWGGEFLKSTPQAVADGGNFVTDAIVDLFKQDVLVRPTPIGGKTELKFDKKEQEHKEKVRVINFQKELSQRQKDELDKDKRKKAIIKQRENVIRTIGGITNFSYEDVMDDQGNMRLDVEVWFNKKNSEMQENDLKKQKQNQVKQATGKINYFMQHNMAGERAGGQHMLSAVG
ncbi:hypothetical protein HYS96_03250 [Candidatus Daviesbacteria bacterium]|nr:hypothetical protein [Candidatus Daviesbacteria bacterium]